MGALAIARTRALATFGLVLLAVWLPFRRDILSDRQLIWSLWLGALVFVLVWVAGRARPGAFRWSPPRLSALAYWLAYVVSGLLVAASPRAAVTEILRHGFYLLLFVAASESAVAARCEARVGARPQPGPRSPFPWIWLGSLETLLVGLWAAVALVAAANLLAAVGILPFNVLVGDRLYTFTHYPNPVGALVGGAFLMGLGLRRAGALSGRLGSALASAGQWLLLVAFLLIMSRGAWLVFPVGLAVLTFLDRPGQRVSLLVEALLLTVAAVATAPFLAEAFGRPAAGAAALVGGLVLAVACGWLARRFATLGGRRQLLVVAVVLVAGVAVGAALMAAGVVPSSLAHRLTAFSFAERSVWERLRWTGDALRLAAASPVLGSGGGGWAARYWQYQTYNYYTAEAHNDFVQTLAETGIVGLSSLLALFGTLGWSAWRAVKRGAGPVSGSPLVPGVVSAAVMLTLHGLLDSDFMLLVPGVIFWLLLGAIDGLSQPFPVEGRPDHPPGPSRRRGTRPATSRAGVGLVVLAITLSLVAASLLAAQGAMRQAVILSTKGQWEESVAAMAQSAQFDPWSTDIRVQRALILEAAAMYDPASAPDGRARAREQYEAALRLTPYDPNLHDTYGLFALRNGLLGVGIEEFDKALELQPFEALRYSRAAEAHFALAFSQLRGGQDEEARVNLERAIEVRALLEIQAAKVPAIVPADTALPAETPTLNLQAGKALALLGRLAEAEPLLIRAHEAELCRLARETEKSVPERKFEAALWLSLIEAELGQPQRAATYLQEIRSASAEADKLRAELAPWFSKAGL